MKNRHGDNSCCRFPLMVAATDDDITSPEVTCVVVRVSLSGFANVHFVKK